MGKGFAPVGGGDENVAAAIQHIIGIKRNAAVFEVVGGVKVGLAVCLDSADFGVLRVGIITAGKTHFAADFKAARQQVVCTDGGGIFGRTG